MPLPGGWVVGSALVAWISGGCQGPPERTGVELRELTVAEQTALAGANGLGFDRLREVDARRGELANTILFLGAIRDPR